MKLLAVDNLPFIMNIYQFIIYQFLIIIIITFIL